jgi:hypothetical protein
MRSIFARRVVLSAQELTARSMALVRVVAEKLCHRSS